MPVDRQQIAEALGHEEWCHYDMDCCGCVCSDSPPREKQIDRLMHLIDRVAADAAADALRDLADTPRASPDDPPWQEDADRLFRATLRNLADQYEAATPSPVVTAREEQP